MSMKVLHLSFSDSGGGASVACNRLHQGLKNIGLSSKILVQSKQSDSTDVIHPDSKLQKLFSKLRPPISKLPLNLYPQRKETEYSINWIPDRVISNIYKFTPDVINLHWICGGFLQIETLAKLDIPIVWTLHDMWSFTGGCHYSDACDRYTQSCGVCPQLNSYSELDISRLQWFRKHKYWNKIDFILVSPSHWLANCAASSSLFRNSRIEVIPNGINTNLYQPVDKTFARRMLNLPQDRKLILFGAMRATSDYRKGFHLLKPALQNLSKLGWKDKLDIVIFGSSEPSEAIDFGLKSHYLGVLKDDISLAIVYSAVDAFIAPSLQDNLPNTVLEALACGIPCVAFDVGGMPDMIEHRKNGFLANPYNIDDFSNGINWVLENDERHHKLRDNARQKVLKCFTSDKQVSKYLSLYEDILKKHIAGA